MNVIRWIAAAMVAIFALGFAQARAMARPATLIPDIPLATSPAQEHVTALGVNAAGRYLAVWDVDAGGGNFDVWGQFIALSGQKIGDPFPIANSGKPEFAARVAYNPQDDEFLVVYEYSYETDDHDIRGQRVDGDSPTLVGEPLAVGVTTGDERAPDVAYLPAASQYLVAYAMDDDIWARRIARRGRGDDGGDFLGDEFPVAADPLSTESAPVVAAADHENFFLIAYVYAFSQDDDDVMAQRVRGEDAAEGPLLGEAFTLAASSERENAPALAYSPQARAFIALWQNALPFSEDVRGRWIDAGNLSNQPYFGSAFDVAADPVALERSPQVAVDSSTGQVLATLAYAPSPDAWYRLALVRLNRDPQAATPVLQSPSLLPERNGHVLTPRIQLAAGRSAFFLGYTIQWGTRSDADTDAYLHLADHWRVMLPMIWR